MGDPEFSFGAGEFKMPVRELTDRDVKEESGLETRAGSLSNTRWWKPWH